MEDDIYFVDNAGLVLVWPFLRVFFQQLNLLNADNDAFRDAAALDRAIHLTQFLVSGQETTATPELALNKLLCGAPQRQPVSKQIVVTKAERKLSFALLNAVTQQWNSLHNTTIDGLRETFLQRKGRLVQKDESWVLAVEAGAFDMLLDRIPWSIGVIQLAWMTDTVSVEWRST